MSMLTDFDNLIFSNLRSKLFFLKIGYLVYRLTKQYFYVFSFPPGPLPVLFFGNVIGKFLAQ